MGVPLRRIHNRRRVVFGKKLETGNQSLTTVNEGFSGNGTRSMEQDPWLEGGTKSGNSEAEIGLRLHKTGVAGGTWKRGRE